MDNAKALVKHANWYEGEAQSAVRSLCNYYNMGSWACQPGQPKQKSRVEAGVGLAQRRIIAAMELERIPIAQDLDALNCQVRQKLEELNNAAFCTSSKSYSRRRMFENKEREHLGALPTQSFYPLDVRVLSVDRAHCIRISSDGHRYSTPPEYIGKRVFFTIIDDKILIYDIDCQRKIAEHKRCFNTCGNKTHLLPEHLTDAEKKYRRQLHEWVGEFVKVGLPEHFADSLVRHLRNGRNNFPCGRACNALMRLFKIFPPAVVHQALSLRLKYGSVTYRETRKCCEQIVWESENHSKQNLGESQRQTDDYLSPMHVNIRGNYK